MLTFDGATTWCNDWIALTPIGKWFRLEGSGARNEIQGARFSREILAGLTTFFAMAYIIAVNASILTDSGGTCVCESTEDPTCTNDADYNQCLQEINRDFITATAAITAFSTCLFGLVTNLPIALAPGMGLNAYFAYQVVGYHGSGPVSFDLALTAVFIEGFIFIGLSLLGLRQWLVRLIPNSLKVASACGIGLYLALIGLSYSAGIGAVTGAGLSAPLDIAGCQEQYRDADTGECTSHKMRNPTMWMGIAGGILTAILMSYRWRSAIIIGIAVVTITSWPRDSPLTYFPYDATGNDRFDFFKKVAAFHPIKHTMNILDLSPSKMHAAGGQFALALVTLLYVDILDTTATMHAMARFARATDSAGDFPRSTWAYCIDAISISIGAVLGSSPLTAFIESGAGIAEGGRTGLTALTTGVCFIISLFFAPIFASIPPWATGSALIIVGCLMMRQVGGINWSHPTSAIPAFVTMIFIPFSYSTAYGLIGGLLVYIAVNVPIWLLKTLSRGRILTDRDDEREAWGAKDAKPPGVWRVAAGLWGKARGVERDDDDEFGDDEKEEVAWCAGGDNTGGVSDLKGPTVVEMRGVAAGPGVGTIGVNRDPSLDIQRSRGASLKGSSFVGSPTDSRPGTGYGQYEEVEGEEVEVVVRRPQPTARLGGGAAVSPGSVRRGSDGR